MPLDDTSAPAFPAIGRATLPAALGLFWVTFIAAYTLRGALLGIDHQWMAFERRCLVAVAGVALSLLMYGVLSRRAGSSFAARVGWTAAMSIPAAVLFATSSVYVFAFLAPMPGESCATGLPCTLAHFATDVSELMIHWMFVFAAWGLLCLSLAAAAAQREALVASNRYREAARLAEIRALRYQINPHFFFNVLNSLQGLVVQNRRADAEALIGEMARLFRATLAADPLAESALADEIDLQARYMAIELRRFPGRLAWQVDLDPAVTQVPVPALILQPLVENAIKHGVAHSSALVTVSITARTEGDMLHLVVADDARRGHAAANPGRTGAPDEAAPGHRTEAAGRADPASPAGLGIGLRNVSERLALHYGDRADCRTGPRTPGFAAELRLPLRRAA